MFEASPTAPHFLSDLSGKTATASSARATGLALACELVTRNVVCGRAACACRWRTGTTVGW